MEEHLTVDQFAGWASLPHAYQVRYAYDLSTGCELCWSALAAVEPTEPRRLRDPFFRAIARVCHPKVDLSLSSQAIRPLIHAKSNGLRPEDFPALLLQESIAQGLETYGSESEKEREFLELPSALAKLLRETAKTRPAGLDLQVNRDCAAVDYFFRRDAERARSALESARQHFSDKCLPSTEVNLKVAELKVACLGVQVDPQGKTNALAKVIDVRDSFSLIADDPVRRFEIVRDLTRTVQCVDASSYADGASWALSELGLGAWANEAHRLNGLFHKAGFATVAGSQLPDLAPAVATELESAQESIYRCGGYFSLARCHELLGKLREDKPSLEQALYTYEFLGLEPDFLETWKAIDRIDANSRSGISDRAYKAFGQVVAHRMAREVSLDIIQPPQEQEQPGWCHQSPR